MATASSSGNRRSQKDKEMAAMLKRNGVERTHGMCAACYRSIAVDSIKSRYKHVCPGGRLSR